ncbi:MAG: ATP-grasp domain-containing protein, partial [Raoultibacter sp.]
LGGTDISWFGYGFRSYEYFLEDKVPDWDRILADKGDALFTMSVLNVPSGMTGTETFDYDAFKARFSHVLALREFDYHAFANFGFLFLKTDEQDSSERDFLMKSDLREYLR